MACSDKRFDITLIMNFKETIFIFIVFLAFGFSSCVNDFNLCPEDELQGEYATLSIFLGVDTRNPFQGVDFEDGVDYENHIDIENGNYRIYFFDSEENTFIGTFRPIVDPSVSNNAETIKNNGGLVFTGSLLPEIGCRFKIVVLANWPDYPQELENNNAVDNISDNANKFVLIKGKSSIKDLTTHARSQFKALNTPQIGSSWLGNDRLMPFYGVSSFDLSKTHPSSLDSYGNVLPQSVINLQKFPIPLLRAMAKVEVQLDDSLNSFDSVEVSRVNSKGFSAPYRDDENWIFDASDYYVADGGWNGNFAKGVHLVNDDNDAGDSSLQFTKVCDRKVNEDGSVTLEKWVAYIPEYRNKEAEKPTSIRVKMKASESEERDDEKSDDVKLWHEFFFTPDGTAREDVQDIQRNNIYRFKIDVDKNVAVVDIQPFSEHKLRFDFGLMRDARGDLMVLPIPKRDENGQVIVENGDTVMTYPTYFENFLNDDNPNHKIPDEVDADGNTVRGSKVELKDGDYYAIVVGENDNMSNAVVWVKDRTGCHVLSNFGAGDDISHCNARLVESFYGNNQSEKFYKDIFGYHRIHHFDNHNSIVLHPDENNMLFRMIDNFGADIQTVRYYEVESWDDASLTGWIINKDAGGKETGFQKITPDGVLGDAVDLNGNPIGN